MENAAEPADNPEVAQPRRIVVAMTGASGAIYGIRLLEALRDSTIETHLVMSEWARRTIVWETDYRAATVAKMADAVYPEDEMDAAIGSGSFVAEGMIVAPCSMRSLAAIANGLSANLIHRAADVALKEHRKLILLVREAPLSVIHLENMLRVARAGAIVTPPVPAFYARPASLDEMVDHTVGRLLDHFGIERGLVRRWDGKRPGGTGADGLA
ncbi:MAG TPA: UbiX family flavin prenyltransferase [Acidimicrobiales bacterium]|nr:UbiX family flavin prenyltransferase [Acidimicrobiales bacterium]